MQKKKPFKLNKVISRLARKYTNIYTSWANDNNFHDIIVSGLNIKRLTAISISFDTHKIIIVIKIVPSLEVKYCKW